MIGASAYADTGEKLWNNDDSTFGKRTKKKRKRFAMQTDFGKYMKVWRFKEIKFYIPKIMQDAKLKEKKDDWWRFKNRIHEFNKSRRDKLFCLHIMVFDESMSAFIPR